MNIALKIIRNKTGFTIVELMIAISILSLILLLSTYGIVRIGALYSKGTNQANTQNAARNILGTVTAQLQLGGATPIFIAPTTAPTTAPVSTQSSLGALCIGSKRYSFIVNHKLLNANNDHVLWQDIMDTNSSCAPISSFTGAVTPGQSPPDLLNTTPSNGSELLSANMRLTDFDVSNTGGLYTITITVAYGDTDLINYTPRAGAVQAKTTCKGGAGSQFCAVASYTTTVAPRLAN